MTPLLHTYPTNPPLLNIEKTEDIFFTSDGMKYLDLTAGGTSYAVIGYTNPTVEAAIADQLKKFSHADYKTQNDPNRDELAELLCSNPSSDLDYVFFSGGSGAEACEMAILLSYQAHCESGNASKWILSRNQSYHGISLGALSMVKDLILSFTGFSIQSRSRVSECNPYKNKFPGETDSQYTDNCART